MTKVDEGETGRPGDRRAAGSVLPPTANLAVEGNHGPPKSGNPSGHPQTFQGSGAGTRFKVLFGYLLCSRASVRTWLPTLIGVNVILLLSRIFTVSHLAFEILIRKVVVGVNRN